ncbi:MAG: hypothetical protein N2560_07295 [Ignavibacteria bacterium]|nr:hypothetical protein [Ignavibacteria bacterium]
MEKSKDVFQKVEIDDLTDDLKLIALACGIETVRTLLRHCAGISFYVPKIARLDKFVSRYVKDNSDKTFKEIARELGVTEQFIKKIFRNKKTNIK